MARKPTKAEKPQDRGLPTKEQILEFLAGYQGKAGKREIARAFGVTGGAKIALKRRLAEMAAEGTLAGSKKSLRETGTLPPSCVLEITGRDADGDLVGKPVEWNADEGERPLVRIKTPRKAQREDLDSLGPGDRVLAEITRLDDARDDANDDATLDDEAGGDGDTPPIRFEAKPLKRLARDSRRLLGIYRAHEKGGGTIEPINRKELKSWSILKGDDGGAADGDLVRFDLARTGRFTTPRARVLESLGNPNDERKISLIAIHTYGIPDDFPASALAETERLAPPTMAHRTDLRDIPLVTIDPADARDHDDAVYAEPDHDPKNRGGHVVIVAIADVAHYVRPSSKLDREAQVRGNSVYFPDRVVPMLPEKISNDLCSLREGEERPCLAVRMTFDATGHKKGHRFERAMMRSAAKLSYQEAQAAIDGKPSDRTKPLLKTVLEPLWAAYKALCSARDKRGPLDLDLPERKIVLNDKGHVAKVVIPERLDAHRLIEEMMIQANVAAAETLELKKTPLVYRVHDRPSKEKLKALRDFLDTVDMKLPLEGQLKSSAFNAILARAKSLPVPELVNEIVLRSQAQAVYDPENIGHFGLNLARYAHFTSPIRRYADLIVHRALIRALKLGDGGLTDDELPRLADVARQISDAERRAMAAERETTDRLIAAYLADRIGAEFDARIGGVTRAGLFVRLKDTGADGFIPMSSLGADYFNHIEEAHALVGSRTGVTYRLGDDVRVRLLEAVPSAGALRFEMLSEGTRGELKPIKGFRGRRVPRNRRPGRR